MIVDTMKVYVAVVEQSNFSRAAELLHLSQPSVSLHIRNLEAEFGVTLLHRSSKHVKMTEAGEILYRHAKQICSLYDEAKQEIHLLKDIVIGSLKIGASFTIGEYILPRLLTEFIHLYPQVDIQISIGNTEEITHGVRTNDLDLGLVEGKVALHDLVTKPFMKDKLAVVAGKDHPLSLLRKLNPDQLQDQVWILRESGSGTRAFSEHFLDQYGLRMKRAFVFNSSQGVKEAVSAGLGITILSEWIVRKELISGEIHALPIHTHSLTRDFCVISGKHTSSSMAVRTFKQHVVTMAKQYQT